MRPPDVEHGVARIDATDTQIEHAGVDLLSCVAPGDEHVVLAPWLLYRRDRQRRETRRLGDEADEGKPVKALH